LRSGPAAGGVLIGWVVVLALVAAALGCHHNAPPATTASPSAQAVTTDPDVRDPSVLVFAHSFTGHTAAAGREIAAMLGGRFVRTCDPPPFGDIVPGDGPRLDAVLPSVGMDGVRRLFLGFPIYDNAPSPIAHKIIQALPLQGVEVVPFFTYVHYVDPKALAVLADEIRARGGVPAPPIALRLPAMIAEPDIVARARTALLQRPDVWGIAPEPAPAVQCVDVPAPHAARTCAVPGGGVWLGDVSPALSGSDARPPRLATVAPFDLDEKEITIAQYRRCVAANKCRERRPHGVSAELERGGDDLPMPDLSWSDAAAYCAFAGMRLPTEAEWVRAARGSSLTTYPWGDEPPGGAPPRANLGEKPAVGLPEYSLAAPDSAWAGDGFPGLAPGCHFPLGRGPFGHCDLIGNLLEWVDSPTPTGKGGSWIDVEPSFVSIAARGTIEQRNLGSYLTGARCARSR
jgi:formylglycine-generating enzyme required for sulfatase activity